MLIVLLRGDDEARELYPKLLQMAAAKLASGHFQVTVFLLGLGNEIARLSKNMVARDDTIAGVMEKGAAVFWDSKPSTMHVEYLNIPVMPIDRLPDLMLDADVCIQM